MADATTVDLWPAGRERGASSARLAEAWAGTMRGERGPGDLVVAHGGLVPRVAPRSLPRARREELEAGQLAGGATRAVGAGDREREEEADPWRTCFERDRDRIVHSKAFRRLAGKTQVFVFPADHQRTRLTHALEVAQVATAVARAVGLNVALTEAIALGHDCGHGPGGHASEGVFDAVLPGGFHHAPFGADVVLAPLNLCRETLDGIRCHSWSLGAPSTPEGAVVSWADRVAYCAHDLEDAVRAGVVELSEVPPEVSEVAGSERARQLDYFVRSLVSCILEEGVVGMGAEPAAALAALRAFDYERIYLRAESVAEGRAVAEVLEALVGHFVRHPEALAEKGEEEGPLRSAVRYVDGMTDRYAFETAVRLLGWPRERLPRGIDVPPA